MLSFSGLQRPFVYSTLACLALFATAAANADDSIAADKTPTASTATVDAKFRIVGYLPNYRAAQVDPEVGKYLTDLVYFSAQIGADGDLQLAKLNLEHIAKLQKIKQQYHTALSLCVGGWERSGGFAKVAAADEARRKFAAALVKFCQDNQFDGADLDWEHPANESEQRDYGLLLATICQAFEPQHLQLTIAVAGWQALTAEAIQAVDRVHLMAYDARGRHSTFDFAEADVAKLQKSGVPSAKICLGVPFYGKGIQSRSKTLVYADIVQKYQPASDIDEVDGVYFNGPQTIERKTKLALTKKLGGIMIWELGQDAPGDASLLRVIHRTAEGFAQIK